MNLSTFYRLTQAGDREALEAARRGARYAHVGDVVFADGGYALVLEINEYPPGDQRRRFAPVVADMTAVQVVTTGGPRWHGKI